MPLNPSIILAGIQPPEQFDPVGRLGAMMKFRADLDQRRAESLSQQDARQALVQERELRAEQIRRAQQEDDEFRTELQNPGGPRHEKILGINAERGQKLLGGFGAWADKNDERFENQRVKNITLIDGVESLPPDMRQAAHTAIRSDLIARGKATPQSIPEGYSSDWNAMQRRTLMTAKERDEGNKPVVVSAGSALVDPRTGQPVYTAPVKPPPPAVAGTFEDYVLRMAKAMKKSPDDLTPRDIEVARMQYARADNGPPAPGAKFWIDRNGVAMRVTDAQVQPGDVPHTTARENLKKVTGGLATTIADFDTSLNDITALREQLGTTGAASRFGAWVPDAVTETTGLGSNAKMRQATIDRVKQVIGKILEGGVLRKEDELKYTKILPTIGDPPEVAKAKLDGLEKALALRRTTFIDALTDGDYDTSKYVARAAAKDAPLDTRTAPSVQNQNDAPRQAPAGGGLVEMHAPDGRIFHVPEAKVAALLKAGAVRGGGK